MAVGEAIEVVIASGSALAGNQVAVVSIAVYSVVVGAYVVLRVAKALADRTAETAAPAELDLETAAV